jgi:hypothetical protein
MAVVLVDTAAGKHDGWFRHASDYMLGIIVTHLCMKHGCCHWLLHSTCCATNSPGICILCVQAQSGASTRCRRAHPHKRLSCSRGVRWWQQVMRCTPRQP